MKLSAAAALVLAHTAVTAQQRDQSRAILRAGEVAGANAISKVAVSNGVGVGSFEVCLVLYYSDISYADTENDPTLKIGYAPMVENAVIRYHDAGAMECGLHTCEKCVQLPENSSIFYHEVEATGGDALFIDSVTETQYLTTEDAQRTWGEPNNKHGWCLSTQPGDFDGNQYRESSACRCRYRFHQNNFNDAYWYGCSRDFHCYISTEGVYGPRPVCPGKGDDEFCDGSWDCDHTDFCECGAGEEFCETGDNPCDFEGPTNNSDPVWNGLELENAE